MGIFFRTKLYNYLITLLTLCFPLYILYLIFANWVNVPFWDEWDLHNVFKAYFENKLSFGVFFSQHNEHRIVFTRLIFLLDQILFSGNRLLVLILQWLLQFTLLIFLAYKIKKLFNEYNKDFFILLPIFSALLFTPTALNVWLWGFEIQYTFSVFFFILSIFLYFSSTPITIRLSCAILLGISSTYSSANGLIIWPTLILATFLANKVKFEKILIIISSLINLSIYFIHYHIITNADGNNYSSFFKKFVYFCSFIGSIFSVEKVGNSAIFGFVGLIILIGCLIYYFNLKDININALLPWILSLSFPIGSALLGSLGRSEYGVAQSLDSRYTMISAIFWMILGLLIMYILKINRIKIKPVVLLLLLYIPIITFVKSSVYWVNYYESLQSNLYYANQVVKLSAYNPTIWSQLYPYEGRLIDIINFNKDHKILPFNDNNTDMFIGKNINTLNLRISDNIIEGTFESLGKMPQLPANLQKQFWPGVEAKGWVYSKKQINKILILDDNGMIWGEGFYGRFKRNDVEEYLHINDSKAEFSGWRGIVKPLSSSYPNLRAFVIFNDSNILYPLRDPKHL